MDARSGEKTDKRPLVTVVMPVFRHQAYLESALRSVLAQDYSPLQVAISDDASPDDAFAFVKGIVDQYDGPHQVDLNSNIQNMSMGNYNRLMEMAEGKFIVVAHDDDIQDPDRVSRLVSVWQDKNVSMVTSNTMAIDPEGRELGRHRREKGDSYVTLRELSRQGWDNRLLGAALSWDREVFDRFGPLLIDGTARTSDWVIPFRAALLRGIYFLDEPLLHWRVHAQQRGQIGRSEDHDENVVEYVSENLTQASYMLDTLRHYRAGGIVRRVETIGVKRKLERYMLRMADVLGTHRNRLHMKGRRMVWVDRAKEAESRATKPI